MPLSIRIISSPDGESISEWNKSFPDDGGEIGRAFGATMQLSDARREVSSSHALIKKTSRGYQVQDKSTNGLYINGSDTPLGKGNQSTLSDGDVLDVGRYRLLVSCFIPEQARVKSEGQNLGQGLFGDDPFSSDNELLETPFTETVLEPDFTASAFDVVDDDPFLGDIAPRRDETNEFNLSFSAIDDDPLADTDLHANLPTPMEALVHNTTSSRHELAAYQHVEERLQQQTDKALEMALSRLLSDIAPQAVETLFDDLAAPTFWGGKPKYWDMYKRYFTRQVENRDWQIKFHAYFKDAMRLQRNLDGGQNS